MKNWKRKYERLIRKNIFRGPRYSEAEQIALEHLDEEDLTRAFYLKALLYQNKTSDMIDISTKWMKEDKQLSESITALLCLAYFRKGNIINGFGILNCIISQNPYWRYHLLRIPVALFSSLYPIAKVSIDAVIASSDATDEAKRYAESMSNNFKSLFGDEVAPHFKIAGVIVFNEIGQIYLKTAFSYYSSLSLSELENKNREFCWKAAALYNESINSIQENSAHFDANTRLIVKNRIRSGFKSLKKLKTPGLFYSFMKNIGIILTAGYIVSAIIMLAINPIGHAITPFIPRSLQLTCFILGIGILILARYSLSSIWNRYLEKLLKKRLFNKSKRLIGKFIPDWAVVRGLDYFNTISNKSSEPFVILEEEWEKLRNQIDENSKCLLEP